jgi:tetratricopeptide (TPR) repeat protein
LLGVQPRKKQTEGNELFKAHAAFSRLILTTNFDPFLQTALQTVNRLYFMSDTPELGIGDEILDDDTDAVHLVYLHGSIHRRSQAATDQDIQSLKEKNARILAPVLKRRGVIVLGYSGWDDVVVEALAACDQFDHLLYWCGLRSDPLAEGAFGPRVPEILRKPSANYVKTEGAGNFIANLCNQLIVGLPRLLDNPIGQLRELLDTVDLGELEQRKSTYDSKENMPLPFDNTSQTFVQAKQIAVECLERAEKSFRDNRTVQQSLSSARVAFRLGNYDETLYLCDGALSVFGIEHAIQAEILLVRGTTWALKGDDDKALADWTRVIEQLPGVPVKHIAKAYINRGIIWHRKSQIDKALTDWTRVIDHLPGAPIEQIAKALFTRGATQIQQDEFDKALADFTRLIEQLSGTPVELLAWALVNRGATWYQKGEIDKALADYSQLIDQLPEAPAESIAKALVNRGEIWHRKGEISRELADYTRVVEQLSDATIEPVARALFNRGIVWNEKNEADKALSDWTRLIERLPGAPTELIADALASRAWIQYKCRDYSAFLADTEAALRKQPEIDVAAFNLGLALLASGSDPEALTAYGLAGKKFPTKIEPCGLADLAEAQKDWLTEDRAKPAVELLRALMK